MLSDSLEGEFKGRMQHMPHVPHRPTCCQRVCSRMLTYAHVCYIGSGRGDQRQHAAARAAPAQLLRALRLRCHARRTPPPVAHRGLPPVISIHTHTHTAYVLTHTHTRHIYSHTHTRHMYSHTHTWRYPTRHPHGHPTLSARMLPYAISGVW